MSADTYWRLAELVGIYSAAIATTFAAVVALRASNIASKIKLDVSASPKTIVWGRKHKVQVFVVSVRNNGLRTATINNVALKSKYPRKSGLIFRFGEHTKPVPHELSSGQSFDFIMDEELEGKNFYDQFTDLLDRNWLRKFLIRRTYRVGVICATGEIFWTRPDERFFQNIQKRIELARTTP